MGEIWEVNNSLRPSRSGLKRLVTRFEATTIPSERIRQEQL